MNRMLLYDYQASWANDFDQIKNLIVRALQNIPVTVQHVGSTAVPGLAAKPVIDIDIVYTEHEEFAEIRNGLERLDYYHNGDQGIPGREAFRRKMSAPVHEVLDTIDHHLYVCRADSEELQRHLLFRDYLRQNEEARIQYQDLKNAIAVEANQDRKTYADLKEVKARVFIYTIVESARKASLSG